MLLTMTYDEYYKIERGYRGDLDDWNVPKVVSVVRLPQASMMHCPSADLTTCCDSKSEQNRFLVGGLCLKIPILEKWLRESSKAYTYVVWNI